MKILIEALHSANEPEPVAKNSGNALTLVVFEILFSCSLLFTFAFFSFVILDTQELCP